jgi:hypothetical protein
MNECYSSSAVSQGFYLPACLSGVVGGYEKGKCMVVSYRVDI